MNNIVQCKVCPVCFGAKVVDVGNRLPKAKHEFECANCRGEGIVPVLTCRGCGRPAMHWDAKVPYCGRDDCWSKLVEVVDLAKVRATNIIPFGPRGYRPPLDPRIVRAVVRNIAGKYWNSFREEFQDEPCGYMDGTRLTADEEARFGAACREHDYM